MDLVGGGDDSGNGGGGSGRFSFGNDVLDVGLDSDFIRVGEKE